MLARAGDLIVRFDILGKFDVFLSRVMARPVYNAQWQLPSSEREQRKKVKLKRYVLCTRHG